MPLANTLDEVVAYLQAIVSECISTGDRRGYFPALYLRVTLDIRDAIGRGDFQDGPRMERLDVAFANRYLKAVDDFRYGRRTTLAWLQAFGATNHERHIVLQHLLIGMNAHINLDLGIAAAEVCPGDAIHGLRDDFSKINEFLFRLIPTVQQEIGEVSLELRELVERIPFQGRPMAELSIAAFRDVAWDFALKLAPLRPLEQTLEIAKRDAEVVLFGAPLLLNLPIVERIKSEENADVASNLAVLARGDFDYTVKAADG